MIFLPFFRSNYTVKIRSQLSTNLIIINAYIMRFSISFIYPLDQQHADHAIVEQYIIYISTLIN